MLKTMLKVAVAPLALMAAATPAQAAPAPTGVMVLANPAMGGAEGAQSEAAIMELFAKMFDTGDKTPIDPAQLELGRVTAGKLLPDGAYGKMMDQMMGSIMKPILAMDPGFSAGTISAKTGMDYEAAEKLTEEQRAAIEAILDPGRNQRTEGGLALISPLLIEAGKLLEPPMREGIARAYARKFSAAQLTEINGFFATPAGAAYAAESFAIQMDPEVLSATMQAMPVMMSKVMGGATEMEAKMKALPQERKIAELNATELAQLAKLTGRSTQDLTEHGQMMTDMAMPASDSAVEAAEGAAMASAATEAASATGDETGSEPWYDRANWPAEDVAAIEALEIKSSEAIAAQYEAEAAIIERARARLSKKK